MDGSRQPGPLAPHGHQVKIEYCDAGEEFYVKTLSNGYGGLFGHHVRGRTEYCPGQRCDCPHRKVRRVWYGYYAAEVWQPTPKLWVAVVWQMTEAQEHCYAGRFARGQVWRVWRHVKGADGRNQPCQAELIEALKPEQVSPVFDYRPTLLRYYRCESVETCHPNPVPKVQLHEAVQSGPPAALASKDQAPASSEQWSRLRQSLADAMKKPAENGRHGKDGA